MVDKKFKIKVIEIMKIAFTPNLKMGKENKARLLKINSIIEEYHKMGYKLTLRQLYYQLVSRNVVPNDPKEYDKLGNLLTKGRMAGVVDWDAIEDRIRVPRHTYEVDSIEDAIKDAEEHYRLDRMADQNKYVEMWVEKDALSNVLSRKTQHYHVRLMVNRGYSSTTAMFDAYERFLPQLAKGKSVDVLYLGDHDPSGLDMVRDIYDRVFRMLANQPGFKLVNYVNSLPEEELDKLMDKYAGDNNAYVEEEDEMGVIHGYLDSTRCYILDKFHIQHIGLTSEQVKLHNPPENTAKSADPRYKDYILQYGTKCWEVDALNPPTLHELIDTAILGLIDIDRFNAMIEKENEDKAKLKKLPAEMVEYPLLVEAKIDLELMRDDLTLELEQEQEITSKLRRKVTLTKEVLLTASKNDEISQLVYKQVTKLLND